MVNIGLWTFQYKHAVTRIYQLWTTHTSYIHCSVKLARPGNGSEADVTDQHKPQSLLGFHHKWTEDFTLRRHLYLLKKKAVLAMNQSVNIKHNIKQGFCWLAVLERNDLVRLCWSLLCLFSCFKLELQLMIKCSNDHTEPKIMSSNLLI